MSSARLIGSFEYSYKGSVCSTTFPAATFAAMAFGVVFRVGDGVLLLLLFMAFFRWFVAGPPPLRLCGRCPVLVNVLPRARLVTSLHKCMLAPCSLIARPESKAHLAAEQCLVIRWDMPG